MSNHQSQSAGSGPPSAGMGGAHQGGAQGPPPPSQTMSQQNLNQIVIEYLVKKGYNRTEQMLRQESSNVDKDGRPIVERAEDTGHEKYLLAYRVLSDWIDGTLDVYKYEANKLRWPLFVYSFIELVLNGSVPFAEKFLKEFSGRFEKGFEDQIKVFETIKLPQQIEDNEITKLYQSEKYRIPLNMNIYYQLITFLETKNKEGGSLILGLLQAHCEVRTTERGPVSQFSFEAIVNQGKAIRVGDPELEEGVPGLYSGVTSKDLMDNNARLKLGGLPMELDLIQDVRAELRDQDLRLPPALGQPSLVEEFDQKIKREEGSDSPSRNEIPLPPSRARDVIMEARKIKENRDRFKVEGRTGGVGPGVSVVMFTFHNTQDSITCIEFSGDNELVAVGTEESYIRVWNTSGEPLESIVPAGQDAPQPSASRRLIGHRASVYSVSFSPGIAKPRDGGEATDISTRSKFLLSSSSDSTIRLWSLETWTNLVVYKGHEGPVWNVRWAPFGHYFLSCGRDKTARIWSQDQVSYVRMLVGHDFNVDEIAWHPNSAYCFSASDGVEKSIRMWSVATGACVRVFLGHTDMISTLECAHNGKVLASADNSGTIIFWDIATGTVIKRCKGHGKGGIYSLSWSAESSVLASGGADGTVRIWDVQLPSDQLRNDGEAIAAGGQADATRVNVAGTSGAQATAAPGVGGKKKGKDTTISPDQISAFPTKKSPVYKTKFTRMNLVMAAGCYLP